MLVPAVCLGLLTLVIPFALVQMSSFWRHTTAFFDVGSAAHLRYRRNRVRALPAAVFGSMPFVAAAWLFMLSPPTRGVPPNPAQVVALIFVVIALIDVVLVVPAIFLLNIPKLLVPPHLRHQPGYLRERKDHASRVAH